MKRSQKIKYMLLGAVLTICISALVIPAFAALTSKNIQVYTGLNLYLNDNKFIPRDANGNQVEVFAYNGTTYLPVRAISEAVGLPIQWEGSTSSVYIGKHSSDKPAILLQALDYFTGRKIVTVTSAKDNYGAVYYDCIECVGFDNTYKINGQYTRIAGTLFQQYDQRSATSKYDTSTLEIYGDGKLLYTAEMRGGVDPIDFNVDIRGVLELRVNWSPATSVYGYKYAAIANCGLYT